MTATENDWTLAGKCALVTGASRGIGRAIAVRLAEAGVRVGSVATTAENCAETVAACNAHTEGALAFGVDVSDTSAVAELVKEAQAALGGLDILINNAGITRDQLLMRMSEDDFDRVIEVNLKGTWNFIKAATRPLMKSGGRIINVASVVGVTGNAGQANYAASKAGLIGLTKSLAREFASRAVTVNAIAPGFIVTDMTDALSEELREGIKAKVPLGSLGEVDDVAAAVEYLAGEGGRYVTGQVLTVDGGMVI